jgi:hypothetical protein
MDLDDVEITTYTDSLDGQFAIIQIAEPVEGRCSNPDCLTEHLFDVMLLDRTLNAVVPFASVGDAKAYATELGVVVGWNT